MRQQSPPSYQTLISMAISPHLQHIAPSTIPEGYQRLTWDLVLEGTLAFPPLVSEDVPTIGDQVGHPPQV